MRFKEFLAEEALLAFHYSHRDLKAGDGLGSSSDASQYELVWDIYKKVADRLGKYWPKHFGYAYPSKRFGDGGSVGKCFEVVAPKDKVTRGNFNHSLHVCLDKVRSFTDRSLPLDQRLVKRNELIEKEAEEYFKAEGDSIELISDAWIVK